MLNSISVWENFHLVSTFTTNFWIINKIFIHESCNMTHTKFFETDLRIALNFCDILFHVACLNATILLESHTSIWKINDEQITSQMLQLISSPPKLFVQQCERLNNLSQTSLTFFAEAGHCFGLSLHSEHCKNKLLNVGKYLRGDHKIKHLLVRDINA